MIYIPGNHDEFLRDYYGSHFGGIEVVEDVMHVTADGRHYLVIHGDLFDVAIKNAVNFIGAFEVALANEARRRGAEGVICGHIHHPVIRSLEGLSYVNCGDWVESCTAVVEHFDGRLEIIDWTEMQTGIEIAGAGRQPSVHALPVG